MSFHDLSKYIVFRIEKKLFAINSRNVFEIIKYKEVTKVPHTPSHIQGIFSFKGFITPSLSLSTLFKLESFDSFKELSIICKEKKDILAFPVDAVEHMIEVSEHDILPIPDIFPESIKRFAKGIYHYNDHFISLIDLDKLLK
jgi:purine-binding chemotaxis protein CheW